MKALLPASFLLFVALPLAAQTVDTIGGTTTPATRVNSSKASLFRVDSTVLMLDYEMYLDVPGVETLTWFVHRHHSRAGIYTLEWMGTTPVNGAGIGPAWYSAGPIALPLVAGNHYMIGVAWPGSLTYYFQTSATNAPVSFGAWQRAMTPPAITPINYSVSATHDSAMYRQRLTTIPYSAVSVVGTGCAGGALVPRLVASGVPQLGASRRLELVDGLPNSLAVISLALGPTLPVPLPLFGCNVWLDLGAPGANTALVTSATGYASLPLNLPANPAFMGLQLSAQGGVVGTGIDMTNAVDLVVN